VGGCQVFVVEDGGDEREREREGCER